ncbi:hypothetical protein OH76DRAFT_1117274 [Lentinus brumalis]|uniref:Uncharacterized protein n=1 Tax=Lentinus brumalis TaxID=2498619 RepID=A0A371CUW3_9APHY|nr:hypothetical protein OH76DRAFT_1117274 [Polyporus brumalis]
MRERKLWRRTRRIRPNDTLAHRRPSADPGRAGKPSFSQSKSFVLCAAVQALYGQILIQQHLSHVIGYYIRLSEAFVRLAEFSFRWHNSGTRRAHSDLVHSRTDLCSIYGTVPCRRGSRAHVLSA